MKFIFQLASFGIKLRKVLFFPNHDLAVIQNISFQVGLEKSMNRYLSIKKNLITCQIFLACLTTNEDPKHCI